MSKLQDLDGLPCNDVGRSVVRTYIGPSGEITLRCNATADNRLDVTDATGNAGTSTVDVSVWGATGFPYAGIIPSGTQVSLIARPAANRVFTGWGGACASSGVSSSCVVVMDGDQSVTMSFAEVAYLPVTVITPPLCRPATKCPDLQVRATGLIVDGATCDPFSATGLGTYGFDCVVKTAVGQPVSMAVYGQQYDFSGANWTGDFCTVASGPTCSGVARNGTSTTVFLQEPIIQ